MSENTSPAACEEKMTAAVAQPNRARFLEQAAYGLSLIKRNQQRAAVLRIGIKQGISIKAGLDYSAYEDLIRLFGERLMSCVRSSDVLNRVGDEEFALFVSGMESDEDVCAVARKIFSLQKAPLLASGVEVFVQGQLGIALFPADADCVGDLFHCAGVALTRARQHESAYSHFLVERDVPTRARLKLDGELHQALGKGEFELFYQPRVSCHDGGVVGVEALLRWNHPVRGLLLPEDFLADLENMGLVEDFFAWSLPVACQQLRRWLDAGLEAGSLSINVSARQFEHPERLLETIRSSLAASRISASRLELEVAEMAMQRQLAVPEVLQELRAMGVRLGIDNFGAGRVGLGYLRHAHCDFLKIDRTLLHEMLGDLGDISIVRAVIALSHNLGLKVVACGVEDEAQLRFLSNNRCDEFQGFVFTPPLPAAGVEVLLQNRRRLSPDLLRSDERKRTLLLVDDEENILSAMRRLFRRDGYQVLAANSGAQGLALLAENQVDVILSDQRMPGMTGVEFLRQAKNLYPDTVRIVLSGYTELQSISDAINEGAIYKFFTKPWDDDQLREQVREAFIHKELAQENLRLNDRLQEANLAMKEANQHLQRVLDERTQRLEVGECSLRAIQDVLQSLPMPIAGFDLEEMVVFANAGVASVPGGEALVPGALAAECLPAPLLDFLRADTEVVLRWESWLVRCVSLGRDKQRRGKLMVFAPEVWGLCPGWGDHIKGGAR